jgi:DNA polymerase-1
VNTAKSLSNHVDLARIVTDLPIDVDFEHCRYGPLNEEQREAALSTVRLFEFKSMIARYASTQDGAQPAEEETTLTTGTCEWHGAESFADVEAWLSKNAKNSTVGFIWDANLGCAFGCNGSGVFFGGALEELKSWLQDESQRKIVHDAKTLKLELCKRNVALQGVVADALLMGYLLDPTRQSHPLPQLAEKYLSRTLPVAEVASVKKPAKSKAKSSLFEEEEESPEEEQGPSEAQQETLATAACALSDLEPALRKALQGIGEEHIFEKLELPLVDVLVAMEQIGMLLDVEQLQKLGETLEADAERLQNEIWESVGEKFNIGSTKQLQVVLYEKLGLAKGRATKTGFSTDVHTLERLAEEHDAVRKILDYRGTTKLKSTYVDALLKGMDQQAHRIHTNLNQTGAVSGRLSSSDPNLQNIPIRTEQGRLIRRAFIAPPEYSILAADYSQVELRILAHITGDEPLVEAFRSGQDVHSRTAADLFDVKVEEVDSDMRRKAKMTNYAIAYGVSGFGLAKQLGSGTAGEAQEFIKRYFEALPGVKNYIDETLRQAKQDGYVQTLMGRRRPLPDINSPRGPERAAAERTAINHPIQGTSADIMKVAMLAIHADLRKLDLRARMTMQVHDELVFEVPQDEIQVLAELVERHMREVPAQQMELSVPLEVEVEIGPNWNDTKPVGDA